MNILICSISTRLPPPSPKRRDEPKRVEEEIEDVQIQRECEQKGRRAVGRHPLHPLHIVGEEEREDDHAGSGNEDLELLTAQGRKQELQNAEDDEPDKREEEESPHHTQIPVGGAREDRGSQREEDGGNRSVEDDRDTI